MAGEQLAIGFADRCSGSRRSGRARPSLADWKTGAHDVVVLTAPDDRRVEHATPAWLGLTWAADRPLWIEAPDHPANGKPVAALTDDRVPILASAAAGWAPGANRRRADRR